MAIKAKRKELFEKLSIKKNKIFAKTKNSKIITQQSSNKSAMLKNLPINSNSHFEKSQKNLFISNAPQMKKHFETAKTNLLAKKNVSSKNENADKRSQRAENSYFLKKLLQKKTLISKFTARKFNKSNAGCVSITSQESLLLRINGDTLDQADQLFILNINFNVTNFPSLNVISKRIGTQLTIKFVSPNRFVDYGTYTLDTAVFNGILIIFNNGTTSAPKTINNFKIGNLLLNFEAKQDSSLKLLKAFLKNSILKGTKLNIDDTFENNWFLTRFFIFKLLLLSNDFRKFLLNTLKSASLLNWKNTTIFRTTKYLKGAKFRHLILQYNNLCEKELEKKKNFIYYSAKSNKLLKTLKLKRDLKKLILNYKKFKVLKQRIRSIRKEKIIKCYYSIRKLKVELKSNYTTPLNSKLKVQVYRLHKLSKKLKFLKKQYAKLHKLAFKQENALNYTLKKVVHVLETVKKKNLRVSKKTLHSLFNLEANANNNTLPVTREFLLLPYQLYLTPRLLKKGMRQLYKLLKRKKKKRFSHWKTRVWRKIKLAYKIYYYSTMGNKKKKKKLFENRPVLKSNFKRKKWLRPDNAAANLFRTASFIAKTLADKRPKMISQFLTLKGNFKVSKKLKRLGKRKNKRSLKKRKYYNFTYSERGKWKSLKGRFLRRLKLKQYFFNFYGKIKWHQFHKIFDKVKRRRAHRTYNWLFRLERRLHTLLMRLRIATTPGTASQLIQHGHILVNTKKISHKNYVVDQDHLIFYLTDKLLEKVYINPYKFRQHYSGQVQSMPNHLTTLNIQIPLFARLALSSKEEMFSWLSTQVKQEIFQKLQHYWTTKRVQQSKLAAQTRIWSYALHSNVKINKISKPGSKYIAKVTRMLNWKGLRAEKQRRHAYITGRVVRNWRKLVQKKIHRLTAQSSLKDISKGHLLKTELNTLLNKKKKIFKFHLKIAPKHSPFNALLRNKTENAVFIKGLAPIKTSNIFLVNKKVEQPLLKKIVEKLVLKKSFNKKPWYKNYKGKKNINWRRNYKSMNRSYDKNKKVWKDFGFKNSFACIQKFAYNGNLSNTSGKVNKFVFLNSPRQTEFKQLSPFSLNSKFLTIRVKDKYAKLPETKRTFFMIKETNNPFINILTKEQHQMGSKIPNKHKILHKNLRKKWFLARSKLQKKRNTMKKYNYNLSKHLHNKFCSMVKKCTNKKASLSSFRLDALNILKNASLRKELIQKQNNRKNYLNKKVWKYQTQKNFRKHNAQLRKALKWKLKWWNKAKYKKNSFFWEKELTHEKAAAQFFKIFRKKLTRPKLWDHFYHGYAYKQLCFYFNYKRLNNLRKHFKVSLFFWRQKQVFKRQLFHNITMRLFIGILVPTLTKETLASYFEGTSTSFRALNEIKWRA